MENQDRKTNINWFPGHMQKAKRQMMESLKLVDIVIEIRDARIPYSSENPMLLDIIGNKPRIIVLTKKDMADSCLAYDTKIFLLSGKVLTIEELYNSDIEHEWVLACDCESKQLKPVKIERVLEKHIPETLLQFTLSNGKTFACTDDHLILMKSGEYKQAGDIAPYDELMPFNYYHELLNNN